MTFRYSVSRPGGYAHESGGRSPSNYEEVFRWGPAPTEFMVIKESSDELNLPIVTADSGLATSRPARSAKDYLALAIATCGVGYLPLAPGTWGSLLAVAFYWYLAALMGGSIDTAPTIHPPVFFCGQLIVITRG